MDANVTTEFVLLRGLTAFVLILADRAEEMSWKPSVTWGALHFRMTSVCLAQTAAH